MDNILFYLGLVGRLQWALRANRSVENLSWRNRYRGHRFERFERFERVERLG